MRARLGGLALICALLPACAQTPADVLKETAANLSDIRSGELTLSSSITSGEDAHVGFSLQGLFSLPVERGALPEADLTYTQIDGDTTYEGRFFSDGETVIVEVDGAPVELSATQVDSFRVEGDDSDTSVFASAGIEQWVIEPEITEQGDTQEITGELHVVRALNGIVTIAARFGGDVGLQPIDEESAEQVQNAVESSTISIVTGAEDRLLRGLDVRIAFAVPEPDLAESLGDLAGAVFELTLEIDEPNREVDVG